MLEIRDMQASDPEVVDVARHLLHHALPQDLGDDRFDDRWAASLQSPDSTFFGVVAVDAGHPVGMLAGSLVGDRLQLDALVAAHVEVAPGETFDRLLSAVRSRPEASAATIVEVWGKPAQPWHAEVATAHGFVALRALHQMRCPLPVGLAGVDTRRFEPGVDDEPLRRLNNEAFAGHPDQGAMSPSDFAAKLAEPGVSPDGIRLYEINGVLAGFCWTKIHRDRGLGEIFAIGLHPDHHGQGLGQPLTASGLHWLEQQGLHVGMLYVEADNLPAIQTYRKLGFEIVRTDRVWAASLGQESLEQTESLEQAQSLEQAESGTEVSGNEVRA